MHHVVLLSCAGLWGKVKNMQKKYNDVPNMHAIVVKYHGPTYTRGSKVSLYSPRFNQRVYIPYDFGARDIVEMAYKELVRRGFVVVGFAETDKRTYTVLCDTFKCIKD